MCVLRAQRRHIDVGRSHASWRVMGTRLHVARTTSGRPLDHRTDIFSLGVVLHEMATGRRPSRDFFSGVVSAILRDTPPSVTDLRSDLPSDLARIIRAAWRRSAAPAADSARCQQRVPRSGAGGIPPHSCARLGPRGVARPTPAPHERRGLLGRRAPLSTRLQRRLTASRRADRGHRDRPSRFPIEGDLAQFSVAYARGAVDVRSAARNSARAM